VYIGVLYVHALYASPQYWLDISIGYLLPFFPFWAVSDW